MDTGGDAGGPQDVPFEEEMSAIKNEMVVTERLLTKLQVANEESKAIRDAAVMKALRDRIDYEVKEFSKAAKSIDQKLEQLDKDSSPDQTRTSIVISLRKELDDMLIAVDSIVEGEIQAVDAAEDAISGPIIHLESVPHRFTYDELSEATGGFAEESKLGRGGFGSVYRGVLPSGIRVAVKQMNHDNAQSQGMKEFKSEVSIISKLRHRNLIEILGWCEDSARKEYMLVYELMPNGSLDILLFNEGNEGNEGTKPSLSWSQRFKILTGTAAVLDYLHQGCKQQVIHRDVKTSNIMLDEEWNAKLGDFGIARLVDDQGEPNTKNMAGTMGYIPPEVFSEGRFTDKTDVFAFGVVVLEVACGRRVLPRESHETGLVIWVRQCLSRGELLSTVDKRLTDYDIDQMKMVLMIGLACCHNDPRERPSMGHVVQMLAGGAQNKLNKMIERNEKESLSPSSSTKSGHENGNHSGKKIWWQPFKSGRDNSGKKTSRPSLRPADNHGAKKNGSLHLRKEDTNTQLERKALGIPENFSYKQLYAATGKFDAKSKIGDGLFGSVYRGELSSGNLVAVKKADDLGREQDLKAITMQLSLFSKLKHPNVIGLLGWCEYGSKTKKKYLLVYEFMPNGSLENVMFSREMACPSWEQRFKLVTGIATALNYLHEGLDKKVIHRNVTNSSVLVDEEWNAKLGSFGFALVGDDHGGEAGFVGTLGFIAPERIAHGPFTEKADVYSFGIVVLEVVCARKAIENGVPSEETFLVGWVRRNLIAGDLHKVVDKRSGNYDTSWIEMLLIVGLLCSQDAHLSRPSMGQVLQMLAGDIKIPSVSEIQQKFRSIKSISAIDTGSDSDSD